MKKTVLNEQHRQLGGKLVDFAGWEMPVEYSGVIKEHLAVRRQAGLFDVSHMGEIEIKGANALNLVQQVTCNDASRLLPGRSQYSALLTPQGTFVDDIMVYCITLKHYLLCVNASNSDKDFQWILSHPLTGCTIENRSDAWGLIALQGPSARAILPSPLKKTEFQESNLAGIPILLSCTGYTGEDGYEIFCPAETAPVVWNHLLQAGLPHHLMPCGLGARDTLRLEACYPLYGHEIDDQTRPDEAGLSWIVKKNKPDFVGKEALETKTAVKKLVGIEMVDPGIARQGARIFSEDAEIGWITSGTFSPLMRKSIAMAYLTHPLTKEAIHGMKIQIDIRGKKREAKVVPLPFYTRQM